MNNDEWKSYRWKIGDRNDDGEPLVVVSGKLIGTVASVRKMLNDYEQYCVRRY